MAFKNTFQEPWKIGSLWTQTGPWSDTASYCACVTQTEECCLPKIVLTYDFGSVLYTCLDRCVVRLGFRDAIRELQTVAEVHFAIVTHWRHSRRLKFERKKAIVFAFASALASTASLVFFDFRDNLRSINKLTFLGCSKKVQKRNLPDFLSLQNPLLVVQFRDFLFLLLLGPKSWSLFYDRIGLKTKFSVIALHLPLWIRWLKHR